MPNELNEQMRAEACPFCGCDDIGVHLEWSMMCKNCGAEGALHDTQKEAIEAWNRRQHGSAAQAVAWRLRKDGEDYGITSYDREQADAYIRDGWVLVQELFAAPPVADAEGVKELRRALEAIADGEGDAQVIAQQTLAALSRKAEQPAAEPKLVLALPDYEKRRIVIASDEVIDGERLVCVAIEEAEQPAEAQDLPPAERDEEMQRDYLPLPGGWEIQTKGNGSTFRIAHVPSGERWSVLQDRLHAPLEQLARDCRAAHLRAAGKGGDGERLDFLAQHEAWIAWCMDGERCRVFHRNEDGDSEPIMGWVPQAWGDNARQAIDVAIAAKAKAEEQQG